MGQMTPEVSFGADLSENELFKCVRLLILATSIYILKDKIRDRVGRDDENGPK